MLKYAFVDRNPERVSRIEDYRFMIFTKVEDREASEIEKQILHRKSLPLPSQETESDEKKCTVCNSIWYIAMIMAILFFVCGVIYAIIITYMGDNFP